MKILITGCAGFIGYHLAEKLCQDKQNQIYGIDNLNSYYDPKLKHDRLKKLNIYRNFHFEKADTTDNELINNIFSYFKPEIVIHLAAQAGVRYSLENPRSYIDSNLVGFFNIINNSVKHKVKNFLYASSSSVYNNKTTDNPASLYAATKKSNELIAHAYSHNYNIQTVGLRFFSVYGPYGRPDMAYFKFTKNIINKIPITVYNMGDMYRDFTYIDDVIEKVLILMDSNHKVLSPIYDIGNKKPIKLSSMIGLIEKNLGKKAVIHNKPMQKSDVYKTKSKNDVKINRITDFDMGISKFIDWYKSYYEVLK